jgi:hypothetical protein
MEKPKQGIKQLPFEWDVTPFEQHVKNITDDEWDKWSYRQLTFKGQHQHTRTIRVQWIPLELGFYDSSKTETFEPYYTNFNSYLSSLYKFLEEYYDGILYKIIIAELKPHSVISPHVDAGFSLVVPHRVHVPVITNTDVIFGCGETVLNMITGNVYEINNQLQHFVKNSSDESRIHLIIDVIGKKDIGNQ